MKQYWSSQRAIANSKVVKSSAIWLFVVPLAAKTLESLNGPLVFTVFSEEIKLTTSLPFSWQMLFFSAVFFTTASIVYSVFCPELVKRYVSYTEFEADGKSRLQIIRALRTISWNEKSQTPKKEYLPDLVAFFKTYTESGHLSSEQIINHLAENFNEMPSVQGKNSNAFYHVYEISNAHTQPLIWISFVLYLCGFAAIAGVVYQNIAYVVRTLGG